jgi:phosphoenolpyruvate carboxylase
MYDPNHPDIAGLLNTQSGDKQLRARVKLFGHLLGNVLLTQAGAKVYDAVEKLRTGFLGLRKEDHPVKRARLMEQIESLDASTLAQVVRAFSTYFSLVNIAEEASQLQQRRRLMRQNKGLWRGSFDHALADLRDMGMTAEQVQTLLDKLAYVPVITAHPTEAKRRSIMHSLRRIFLTNEKLAEKTQKSLSDIKISINSIVTSVNDFSAEINKNAEGIQELSDPFIRFK